MADCFISYSSQDKQLATFVYSELQRHGVTVFMASASLQPSQCWSHEILSNLKNSNWVVLLASRAAAASTFVNQEIGGALLASKHLVPIVWDMDPSELPGWAQRIQAIDLRRSTMDNIKYQVANIAAQIQQEKTKGLLIAGAIFLGLLALADSN